MIPTPPMLTVSHEVLNQAHALENYNAYLYNLPLQEAVAQQGAGWAHDWLIERGAEVGSAEWIEHGRLANVNPPQPRLFDRYGNRRDEVEFHPSWHECLGWLKRHGCDTGPWADPRPGAHVARAAAYVMFAEIEDGSLCPATMTYGAVPVLRHVPEIARDWMPKMLSREYDKRFIPAAQKRGVLIGMGLTEKQGGSDVRANTTRAEQVGSATRAENNGGDENAGNWRLTGHKWFLSAPMCDAFLVTAQSPKGLSCFFVPRWTPEGQLNEIRIQRFKDKLGDRSNAGTEAEFWGSRGWLVGEEGRGIPTVLEMGVYTRLDCAIGSTGIMRGALSQALHHAGLRAAFGKLLRQQPLMMNVLADMAVETEAATALSMRLARAFDAQEEGNEGSESLLRRILTPVAKYWICKRCPTLVAEAMEVHGGNGYVDEGPMPRLFRQSPLNSIWEGSGNVMCLDTLRAMGRHPRSVEVLAAEIAPALGKNRAFDAFAGKLKDGLNNPQDIETRARELTQGIALAMQGALLLCHAPEPVAAAFCASRLTPNHWGAAFGTLPAASDFAGIIERAWPGS
ncbi:MAG: isovaleryl-CoA dehydrogenase [Sulfuritalea sp.]|nr:isovaleryl-CoA dehydrogenase [Sulfuritalea sp.]